jgi:hypothetical protein
VDDTTVILPAQADQLAIMQGIVTKYNAWSVGFCINFHKSAMIPIIVPETMISSLAASVRCIVGKMPFTCLGLPLGTTKRTIQDLMPLVYRIERKMIASFTMMSYGASH